MGLETDSVTLQSTYQASTIAFVILCQRSASSEYLYNFQ